MTKAAFLFPDSEGGLPPQLRVRRDLPLTSRKLFYHLCNARQAASQIPGADNISSAGFGGTVDVLTEGRVPVPPL